MGAGVSTNPHFPRVETAVPVKACRFSLGGSGSDTSLTAPANSLSGPDQASLPGGPLSSSRRISLSCQVPVCGSAPESRGSTGRSGKWERHGLSPCLTLLPSLALPVASTAFILADVRRFGASSGLGLETVAGRPPLATRRSCHASPSRTNEYRLWITCITGISGPPSQP